MATIYHILSEYDFSSVSSAEKMRFGIVMAEWNDNITIPLMEGAVKTLKKQGYTIIYVTNVMDEILIADRVVVLEKGEIIKEFNKEEILENIEFLEEHEIKIPSLAKMLYEFKKNGIEIKLEEWTKEELTNKIIEVAKK